MDLVSTFARTAMASAVFMISISHAMSQKTEEKDMETITLGAGCFWCVEAVFESLNGVESAVSGYMGGPLENPSYREVSEGTTGHAEVVAVQFDPQVLALSDLLDVFFATHDPTTLNRQGADIGTQYRSVIFYDNEKQQEQAVMATKRVAKEWEGPIVTAVVPATIFYEAEDYHQAYFELNGEAPYCRAVIVPKIKKVNITFQHLLKVN